MKRTRTSLYYLFSYLLFGGMAFLFFPQLSLRLFQSTGDYPSAIVQLVGVLLLALAVLVIRAIRTNAEALYPTTLVVRAMILAVLVYLSVTTRDPLFMILSGIVGLGVLLTGTSYLLDRK